MGTGFIYMWENTLNSKKYIGSHKGSVNDNYIGSGTYFKKAYNKNKEYFKRYILYIGENYREYEFKLLKKLNVADSENFYNLKNDAIGGWEHTHNNIETIKYRNHKISLAKKGIYYRHLEYDKNGVNNPMYGKKHTKETKDKIAISRIGKKSVVAKKIIEQTSGLVFKSVSECAKYFNVTQPTMSYLIKQEVCIKGKCKGKIFNYA
jgi:hypothetical protein